MSSVYFDPAVGGDGSTVSDDSNGSTGLASGGHRTRFVPALSQVVSLANFAKGRATEADVSAAAAADSAILASEQVSLASDQVALATTQAGNAVTSAGIATAKAGEASASAEDAAQSAAEAAATAASVAYPLIKPVNRSSNTAIAVGDAGVLFNLSGTFTQTINAVSTLYNGWHCRLRNTGNGDITIDPNASELISNVSTYVLKPGFTILLTCNGTSFDVLELQTRTYQNCNQYTANGSLVVPADTFVIRAYAVGAGAAGNTTMSGGGGGCAFGDIAVTPGETITFTIASGVATVISQSITRLTGGAASGLTAGTASKHTSVVNGGAYSGGDGGTGFANGGGASSGSPLGAGVSSVNNYGGGNGWGGIGGSYGGGAGSAAGTRAGDGLSAPSIDPLLYGLEGRGTVAAGNDGGPGCGGGPGRGTAVTIHGGNGGFGGGGGGATTNGVGGAGGFGGGGGGCDGGAGTVGGAGGFGGGGGWGVAAGGAGGAAVIRIYY